MLGVVVAALLLAAPASAAAELKVGVGRADITPPTGYYMMGWVRSDAVSAASLEHDHPRPQPGVLAG